MDPGGDAGRESKPFPERGKRTLIPGLLRLSPIRKERSELLPRPERREGVACGHLHGRPVGADSERVPPPRHLPTASTCLGRPASAAGCRGHPAGEDPGWGRVGAVAPLWIPVAQEACRAVSETLRGGRAAGGKGLFLVAKSLLCRFVASVGNGGWALLEARALCPSLYYIVLPKANTRHLPVLLCTRGHRCFLGLGSEGPLTFLVLNHSSIDIFATV